LYPEEFENKNGSARGDLTRRLLPFNAVTSPS